MPLGFPWLVSDGVPDPFQRPLKGQPPVAAAKTPPSLPCTPPSRTVVSHSPPVLPF